MKNEKQEAWLTLRAQAGDRAALDELLKSVQEPLYRYLLPILNDAHLAEDVLQETMVQIFRKLYWLRDAELFRPWAYRIASRQAFKHLRRERRWEEQIRDEALLEDVSDTGGSVEDIAEVSPLLDAVLTFVSPASRAALLLHYRYDLTIEEVAVVLEIPVGTVKSRLAYGLTQLRRQLQPSTAVSAGGER